MKARFTEQQPPVKIIQKDGNAYVYICQNETQGTETYPMHYHWKTSRRIQRIIWIMSLLKTRRPLRKDYPHWSRSRLRWMEFLRRW